jgi:hypothetical protein
MSIYNLKLGDFQTSGSKVFTGRERGIEVREASKIDDLVEIYDEIIIELPANLRSINPSFLEEFFYNVIPKYGASGFHSKIKFTEAELYNITEDLEDAINRRLRENNALVC